MYITINTYLLYITHIYYILNTYLKEKKEKLASLSDRDIRFLSFWSSDLFSRKQFELPIPHSLDHRFVVTFSTNPDDFHVIYVLQLLSGEAVSTLLFVATSNHHHHKIRCVFSAAPPFAKTGCCVSVRGRAAFHRNRLCTV